jgi:hypothetical protein
MAEKPTSLPSGNRSRVGWSILEELGGSSSVWALVPGDRLPVRGVGSSWKIASVAHHQERGDRFGPDALCAKCPYNGRLRPWRRRSVERAKSCTTSREIGGRSPTRERGRALFLRNSNRRRVDKPTWHRKTGRQEGSTTARTRSSERASRFTDTSDQDCSSPPTSIA